jgi:hypothetical protein
LRLSPLDTISENVVGRTGFEPVTSSMSGKSRADPGVCHRRTESNGEPLTCGKNLIGSCYVRGRLNTLAPISGSHSVWSAGSRSRRQIDVGCSVPIRSPLRGRGQLANQSSRDVQAGGEWPPAGGQHLGRGTAEWAGQVQVPRQPRIPMSGCRVRWRLGYRTDHAGATRR